MESLEHQQRMENHWRVEKMFELAQHEFRQFSRIPLEQRLSSRRDLCAMIFLDKKLPDSGPMVANGNWQYVYLSVDVNSLDLTQDDIVYLRRCGVYYDEECFSLVLELVEEPWRKSLPQVCGHYFYRQPGIPCVPRRCYAKVYSDPSRPIEITPANGEPIDDWRNYEFKGPLQDKEWDFPAIG